MSAPEKNDAVTFSSLPKELRLQIWELLIIPSVHRVSAISPTPTMQVQACRTLVRSTAPARAALAVSRDERALLLRWLLPNEMPVLGQNPTRKHGVLRFHASRDIICFVWEVPRRQFISVSVKWWLAGRFQEGAEGADQRPAWMSQIQNMAMELAATERSWPILERTHLGFASFGLGNQCSWFTGLKQLYMVCEPQDEPPRPQCRIVARIYSDRIVLVREMLKGYYVVRTNKEHVRAAFLHTGTYPGRDEAHTYMSGAAAIERLQMSKMACAEVEEVFGLNRKRRMQELRGACDDGLGFDVKVSVLLHMRN